MCTMGSRPIEFTQLSSHDYFVIIPIVEKLVLVEYHPIQNQKLLT